MTLVLFFAVTQLAAQALKNGFDLGNSLVPADKILTGGPGRNGIPAINRPHFINRQNAAYMQNGDRVLGISYQGIVKAYPVRILNWHEIVNDSFNGHPVTVTFCPLCNSGIAYSALIKEKKYHFGVSGLLYNSDVLLYDIETESLWSQLMNQAIAGPLRGTKLKTIPLAHTSWEDWQERHPDTLVLTEQTGFKRDYSLNPYKNYRLDRNIWFPVENSSNHYHPKTLVLGIEIDGQAKAYPFPELTKAAKTFKDELAKQQITITFNRQHQTAAIYAEDNQELPSVITFWFAWYAFHPETLIFKAE